MQHLNTFVSLLPLLSHSASHKPSPIFNSTSLHAHLAVAFHCRIDLKNQWSHWVRSSPTNLMTFFFRCLDNITFSCLATSPNDSHGLHPESSINSSLFSLSLSFYICKSHLPVCSSWHFFSILEIPIPISLQVLTCTSCIHLLWKTHNHHIPIIFLLQTL